MACHRHIARRLVCELLSSALVLFLPLSAMAQNATHAVPPPSSVTSQIALFQDTLAEGCLIGGPQDFQLVTGFNGLVFSLQAAAFMLKPYVGHQVALTGIPTPGPAEPYPATLPGTRVLNFEVEFINDLGPRCTGGSGPPINLEVVAAKQAAEEEAARPQPPPGPRGKLLPLQHRSTLRR